jgi:hypothetical protein
MIQFPYANLTKADTPLVDVVLGKIAKKYHEIT